MFLLLEVMLLRISWVVEVVEMRILIMKVVQITLNGYEMVAEQHLHT